MRSRLRNTGRLYSSMGGAAVVCDIGRTRLRFTIAITVAVAITRGSTVDGNDGGDCDRSQVESNEREGEAHVG